MPKMIKQFMLNCDFQTYVDFQNAVGKGNVTKALEEYMVTVVGLKSGDTDKIDLDILENEINKLSKDLSKIQTKLQNKITLKEKMQTKIQEKEIQRLEAEKKAIEEAKKCYNCGMFIQEGKKVHEFPVGNICNGCFMSMSNEQYENWAKGKKSDKVA